MTSEALQRYVVAASQLGSATGQEANAAYKNLVDALREISGTHDAISELCALLNHPNDSVVLWTASQLLPYQEDAAKAALKRLAETGPPSLSMSAEVTLDRWKSGSFAPDVDLGSKGMPGVTAR